MPAEEGGGEKEGEEGEGEEERGKKEKARIDDLWASFKQDTSGPTHKHADSEGKVMNGAYWLGDPLPSTPHLL